MKKQVYYSPRVKVVTFNVENGFQCSQGCEEYDVNQRLEAAQQDRRSYTDGGEDDLTSYF